MFFKNLSWFLLELDKHSVTYGLHLLYFLNSLLISVFILLLKFKFLMKTINVDKNIKISYKKLL